MKGKFNFIAGLLLGALLFGGTTAMAASGILATPFSETGQKITLNGTEVQMTGYTINGNNYFKLRDIGEAVDFGVTWNGKDRTVEIDTSTGYIPDETVRPKVDKDEGTVILPTNGTKYVPRVGDVIKCTDGTNYKITDLSHYREDPGPLPKPTCDWSQFPELKLPQNEARHLKMEGTDYLFVRNLYEMRRMQYTMYNAIGGNEQTWKDGKLVLRSDGSPMARIALTIPDGEDYDSFWPWRPSQLTDDFNACPPGLYQLEAWDVYADGKFLYTEYAVSVR